MDQLDIEMDLSVKFRSLLGYIIFLRVENRYM
jgi:hypothetical protein